MHINLENGPSNAVDSYYPNTDINSADTFALEDLHSADFIGVSHADDCYSSSKDGEEVDDADHSIVERKMKRLSVNYPQSGNFSNTHESSAASENLSLNYALNMHEYCEPNNGCN